MNEIRPAILKDMAIASFVGGLVGAVILWVMAELIIRWQ